MAGGVLDPECNQNAQVDKTLLDGDYAAADSDIMSSCVVNANLESDSLPRRNFTLIIWHHHCQTPIPYPINHPSRDQGSDIVCGRGNDNSNSEDGRPDQQRLFSPEPVGKKSPSQQGTGKCT